MTRQGQSRFRTVSLLGEGMGGPIARGPRTTGRTRTPLRKQKENLVGVGTKFVLYFVQTGLQFLDYFLQGIQSHVIAGMLMCLEQVGVFFHESSPSVISGPRSFARERLYQPGPGDNSDCSQLLLRLRGYFFAGATIQTYSNGSFPVFVTLCRVPGGT